ncbi:D-Ala-D-Ala carboxypeptidase family metallohydrolase, partial [Micromonospora sp. NPDC048986]|uniref:D-Ala-D-Ala carboxypeptidase family metallohydrolase n=1 Tax=Micromonospora sp. NPDC048986 TaxID=3155644 RepID=UPI0034092D6C
MPLRPLNPGSSTILARGAGRGARGAGRGALRKSLGDKPLYVSSGFRSRACNNQVGGAS